ncbi:MAG: hypothetical protein Q4B09_03380 [Lachnospiraceae bacterium]|nr:hypothetical protein [Lachnospiraceae bacterium]
MSKKYENLERLIYIALGVMLAFIFEHASRSAFNGGTGRWHGYNFNLVVYVGALAAAFILFLIAALVIDSLRIVFAAPAADSDQEAEPARGNRFLIAVLYGLYSVSGASLVFLIYKIYANECNLYPGSAAPTYLRQMVPHKIYFIAIFFLAASLLFTVTRLKDESVQNKKMRAALAVVFAAVSALALYCPNIFTDRGAGAMHIHAVLNSMIHAANHVPYDDFNCSIYGHYGLLCVPLVKLLGNDLYACMQTLSVVGFIAFLAAFYTAHKLIRSDIMYFIALLGMTGTTTILTRRGQYFQINPLRLLFPCLMLAVIAGLASRTSKVSKIISHILALLCGIAAVIWNFETGLFCVAVMMCVLVFRVLYRHPIFSKQTIGSILLACLYGLVCISAAWGIVGKWNIANGGTANTFRQFVYPLFSGTYNVNNLRLPLPSVYFLYFFEILLFFMTLIIVLRLQHNKETGDEAVDTLRFAVALSGLSSLIYFMNRAAYGNMSITHLQLCMLLASWGEYALTVTKENRREKLGTPSRWLSFVIASVLFGGSVWMAVEGTLYIQVCYDYRATSVWNTESMNEGIEKIRAEVPEEALAFGTYVPEVYFQLGRDTGCVVTDWSDMNDLNRSHALALAKYYNYVFTSDTFEDKDFKLVKDIQIEGLTFHLFERKEPLAETLYSSKELQAAAAAERLAGLQESEAEAVLEES